MAKLAIQCVMGEGIASEMIEFLGVGGQHGFSHVDLLLDDCRLLGARSDECGGQPPGVRIRPANYETWKRRVVFSLDATDEQHDQALAFAMEQIGKPYDPEAILAFVADRDWRDDRAWFCSELGTRYPQVCGRCPELYLPDNKIVPTTCAVIWSAIGAAVMDLTGQA